MHNGLIIYYEIQVNGSDCLMNFDFEKTTQSGMQWVHVCIWTCLFVSFHTSAWAGLDRFNLTAKIIFYETLNLYILDTYIFFKKILKYIILLF